MKSITGLLLAAAFLSSLVYAVGMRDAERTRRVMKPDFRSPGKRKMYALCACFLVMLASSFLI